MVMSNYKKFQENSKFNMNIWKDFLESMQLAMGFRESSYKYDYKLKNVLKGCKKLTKILAELSGGR